MKIIYICHYAGSVYHGMAFRPYYLSREWVKKGHEVTIIGASFSHLRQKNIEMTQDMQEEIIDGIRYVWLNTPEYHGNGVNRMKNMLAFIRRLYKYLPKITENFVPDAVIASSTYPLDAYPANWIAKKHKAKFVFELHDLWPMSPQILGHMSKWHPFIWIMQRAEDYWCRNADVVISLLSDAYKHLTERGMSMDKYHVLPNGINLSEWERNDVKSEVAEKILQLKEDGSFIVGYVGGHALNNYLDFILDCAHENRDEKVKFVLVGKGQEKEHLQQRVADEGLGGRVYMFPAIPKEEVSKALSAMDILTWVVPDMPLYSYGVSPNKLYDYLMSDRVILASVNTPHNLVAEADCGFVTPPGDIDAYWSALKKLRDMSPEERAAMAKRGKDYILANCTYGKIADKFIDAVK